MIWSLLVFCSKMPSQRSNDSPPSLPNQLSQDQLQRQLEQQMNDYYMKHGQMTQQQR